MKTKRLLALCLVLTLLLSMIPVFGLNAAAAEKGTTYTYFTDGISGGTNYDVQEENGSVCVDDDTTNTLGVTWDETEQCAVFDGEAYYFLENPLYDDVDALIYGCTISLEAYVSSENGEYEEYYTSEGYYDVTYGYQRLFNMCDEFGNFYIDIIAGTNAPLCPEVCEYFSHTDASRLDVSNGASYYDAWHTYTIVIDHGPDIDTGNMTYYMTYYIDGEAVGTLTQDEDVSTPVTYSVLNDSNCYIGTCYGEATRYCMDDNGFFIGKVRNMSFTVGVPAEEYTLSYETNGGEAIASVQVSALPDPLPTPVKSGEEFAGWFTDSTLETPAVPGTALTEDTTLYAKWDTPAEEEGTTYTYFVDGLSGGNNYDVQEGNGSVCVDDDTTNTLGVTWDEEEQCAVFDGQAYYFLENPLYEDIDTVTYSYTISLEAYVSSENDEHEYYTSEGEAESTHGYQRLFNMCDGGGLFYIDIIAGTNAPLCPKVFEEYQTGTSRLDVSDGASYYDAWHTYTIVFDHGTDIDTGNMTCYMTYYIDGEAVGTLKEDETAYPSLTHSAYLDSSCYIGTCYAELDKRYEDDNGFFIGKVRNISFTVDVPAEEYTLSYETNGGDEIASVQVSALPDPLPTPVKSGEEFAGWFTDSTLETSAVPGTALTEDTTLYAKWDTPAEEEDTAYTYFVDGLSGGNNYDVQEGNGSVCVDDDTTNTLGVTWDETEQCAVFDGQAYYFLENPLYDDLDIETYGCTISLEAYVSSENGRHEYYTFEGEDDTTRGYQRLFSMCDEFGNFYIDIIAGTNAPLCPEVGMDYLSSDATRLDVSNGASYYDAWHTYTIVFDHDTDIDTGDVTYYMTYYIDGEAVGTMTQDEVADNGLIERVSSDSDCYIGTCYGDLDEGWRDDYNGFFIGKIRNMSISVGTDEPSPAEDRSITASVYDVSTDTAKAYEAAVTYTVNGAEAEVFHAGDLVTATVSVPNSMAISEMIATDVTFTQTGKDTFTFTMPDSDVALTVNLKKIAIKSAYLHVNEDINVVYTVQLPEGFENASAEFTFMGKTYTVTEAVTDTQGRTCFEFTHITPQYMGEGIDVTLLADLNGYTCSCSNTGYSVKKYCTNMLAKTSDTYLTTLLSDTLAYGAAAQTYMDYKTDSLVTDGLNLQTSTFPGLSGYAASFEGTADADTYWKSASLTLGSNVTMVFTFYAKDIENLSVNVTVAGRTKTYTEFTALGDDTYSVVFPGIHAAEYNSAVSAGFSRSGAQVGNTLKYSVNTYLCSKQSAEDAALAGLVQALYNYGASALTYYKERIAN